MDIAGGMAMAPQVLGLALAATARTGGRRMAPTLLETRVADVEQKIAVHEAVCAERYKAMNMKLAAILGVQGIILVALAGGSPVAAAIRAAFGS